MKSKIAGSSVFIFMFSVLVLPGMASAQTGMMGKYGYGAYSPASVQSSEVNSILGDILSTQKVKSADKVDCAKVTDSQFEKLGDAYMGVMIPNKSQHEAMDKIMGGEGSASLTQAHINMGRSYLGCWSGYNSGPIMMSMMNGFGNYGGYYGPGMMGVNYGPSGYGYGMMGSYLGWHFWIGWLVMALFIILMILGIIVLVKYLQRR